MNEESKSIWKKSWRLPGSFLGWLVLVVGLALFTSFLGALIVDGAGWKRDAKMIIVVTAISAAGALLFLFIRRLCSWLNFKRFLFGLACFATLIALFYAEEDWRGWHAWQKFKHQWEAKGERFDAASVIPPTVPDDQNFALTPIVAGTWEAKLDKNGHQIQPPNTNVVNRLKMSIYCDSDDSKNWPTNGNWQKSALTDLKGWQQYYRNAPSPAKTNEFPIALQPQSPAADVLLALGKYDSAIEELRQASKLPYSRFPVNYSNENPAAILLPHLAVMKRCSQVLQLRAIAELQNGQRDEAFADVKLMLRLADSVRTEPILISHLVRIAIVNLALQPVWEGLAEHKWSDAQLVELERELAGLDFLPDYKLSMHGGELVLCQGGIFDYLRRHPEQLPGIFNEGNSSPPALARILCRLIPSGWIYQNQLRCARVMLEQHIPAVDTKQGIVSPTAARHSDAAVEADIKHLNPYNFIEKLFLPSLGAAANRFAYGQESADLARVAIALERYRLAHGEYPESLDALAPQFIAKLPHDIINGQPLKYRHIASSRFVLYSVGWNEIDDNGEVGLTKSGGVVDRNTGDWVWRYPAK